jgi:hypothetical protein
MGAKENKTVKEWLNTQNEPYKTLSLNNTNTDILRDETNNLIGTLYHAFTWSLSAEGSAFWEDYVQTLENIEILNDNKRL